MPALVMLAWKYLGLKILKSFGVTKVLTLFWMVLNGAEDGAEVLRMVRAEDGAEDGAEGLVVK